ncbi:tryptophan--tRNA ligase [Candidatus Liberibacter americanus]|uniref:Tryptophan--tRNA ligase n=1 Tax=Candidatus Liberibacter americanus str. Sao Paulo TaxID=1261131 RepID=U6B6N7_9HYPH|nr:tryptophan--tRNA ligase [Candidatus Liberibacter americanus]AHA27536.1 Tryptophanyl-tRNA synthetase [Candidatus Liberibacter americanus str. Sao Paulo]EMS36503.1 tryptophanyl-tRNA synthetase [Candidatus Liberibacter americanus PW_SP]
MESSQNLLLSGVQPTGGLHLGNYLSVINRVAKVQQNVSCKNMYFIADLHSITNNMVQEDLKDQSRLIASSFLAAGIDPYKHIIFKQSAVSQHSELAWILNCVARMGWMNNMIQFKEKSGKNSETSSLGLYAYPVLMAADILLYRATHVLIGEDQKQHIELTRLIAHKFNTDFMHKINEIHNRLEKINTNRPYEGFFPIVKTVIDDSVARIKSLKDASKKMSKSDPSDLSRINLLDDSDTIAMKIKKAKTDSNVFPSEKSELDNLPEVKNLIGIFTSIQQTTIEEALKEFGGRTFSQFKSSLTEVIIAELLPVSTKIKRFLKDKTYIDSILIDGANEARTRAQETMLHIHDIIGL